MKIFHWSLVSMNIRRLASSSMGLQYRELNSMSFLLRLSLVSWSSCSSCWNSGDMTGWGSGEIPERKLNLVQQTILLVPHDTCFLEGDGSVLFWDNSPHLPRQFYRTCLLVTFQNEHPTAVGYFVQIIRWRNTKYISAGLTNIRRLSRFQGKKQFLAFEEGLSSPTRLAGSFVSSYEVISGLPPKFPDWIIRFKLSCHRLGPQTSVESWGVS